MVTLGSMLSAAASLVISKNKSVRRLRALRLASLVVGLSLGLAACKQGEGQRCELNEDCAEGSCISSKCLSASSLLADGSTAPVQSRPVASPAAPDAGLVAADAAQVASVIPDAAVPTDSGSTVDAQDGRSSDARASRDLSATD